MIEEIIKIKLQLIEIFEEQIELLKSGKITKIVKFQSQEESLFTQLEKYRDLIKENKKIITDCEHNKLSYLTQLCLKFQKVILQRHQLIEDAAFVNNKLLSCIRKAIQNIPERTYNGNGKKFCTDVKTRSVVI